MFACNELPLDCIFIMRISTKSALQKNEPKANFLLFIALLNYIYVSALYSLKVFGRIETVCRRQIRAVLLARKFQTPESCTQSVQSLVTSFSKSHINLLITKITKKQIDYLPSLWYNKHIIPLIIKLERKPFLCSTARTSILF